MQGKIRKLNVLKTWEKVFAENETRAKQGKAWTDEQITAEMKKEFPDRKSRSFETPQALRQYLNRKGGKQRFKRYDSKGEVITRAPRTKKTADKKSPSKGEKIRMKIKQSKASKKSKK